MFRLLLISLASIQVYNKIYLTSQDELLAAVVTVTCEVIMCEGNGSTDFHCFPFFLKGQDSEIICLAEKVPQTLDSREFFFISRNLYSLKK